jgi:translin
VESLEAIEARLVEDLGAAHAAREHAFEASRRSIRASANAIRAIHRGERALASELVGAAEHELRAGEVACADQPAVAHAGFLHDAAKELAEARTTFAVICGEPLPSPDELGVSAAAYANGLAECVGEIRRHLLDQLRAGAVERSEELLGAMDDIYAILVKIDYPDGVTHGLRRSTDVARSIIERTRGDLTTALVQARLQAALEAHRRDVLDR